MLTQRSRIKYLESRLSGLYAEIFRIVMELGKLRKDL